ncbi:Periplasmic murein peptide-binding protein precursor [uncultured Clostridium sp.]|uniref:ABC transporter substrate-binding protein n=1 Tax=uncultured Clostridium sp. TaxID=59620 RepID=UPI000820C4F0|nr:ABC transporter substrate-binding protein [uncultured Clostridium sp.]SCK00930.1 Periplasmic murein peptide-binding protein precursor [uncultured Clostridium sp.]
MKRIFVVLGLFVVSIIFLLGFVDQNPSKQVKSEADIVYSINNIPSNLETVGSLSKREQDIICAVSKGLVELDTNGELVPALAESVDIRDNGIEYDFKIRDDVYWSDGNKITPSDIVEFLREVVTLESEEDIQPLLNIFGISEYRNGNKAFNNEVGITATDTNLIIRLNSQNSNFLNELTKPQYRLRKSVILWEEMASNYTTIPYSGNYSIADINSSNEITLKRNNTADSSLAKTIHMIKDDGEDLALAAFEIGERDIVLNPPKSQLSRLSKEGKLVSIPSNKSIYLAFNKNNILSIDDRKEIYRLITKALEDYEANNGSLIKLADGSYFRGEDQDLSKLQDRKVMSTVGEEAEIPEVVYLACEESLLNKEIVDYISNWFADNTDITLVGSLLRGEITGDISYYDMAIINLDADYSDKTEFYKVISPYISEDLINKVRISKTVEEEKEILTQIEDNLFENYSVLPLIFYNDNIAVNSAIENINLDGNGNLKFEITKK